MIGYGIGRSFYEVLNYIMNYYDLFDNVFFKNGIVIVFELFILMKVEMIVEVGDGWMFKILDKSMVV